MSFVHDTIKILYINIGYLPNYPYHLISDGEMFDAFMREDGGVFADYYPCGRPIPPDYEKSPWIDLSSYDPWDLEMMAHYNKFKLNLFQKILDYMDSEKPEVTTIPNWVYSYMLLSPISYESAQLDIDYLYQLLNIDSSNQMCQFNKQIAKNCYDISLDWLKKTPSMYDREPSMFGEAHVIKSLRLMEAVGEYYTGDPDQTKHYTHGELHDEGFTHDILSHYKQEDI